MWKDTSQDKDNSGMYYYRIGSYRTVYTTQYTIHSIQYTVYNTQYTVYNTQYTINHLMAF